MKGKAIHLAYLFLSYNIISVLINKEKFIVNNKDGFGRCVYYVCKYRE